MGSGSVWWGVFGLTKEELKKLVDEVFVLWNQQVPAINQKDLYSAWWSMLHDLDYDKVQAAARTLSALDTYMPRPGNLRRKTISLAGQPTPPTPIEAWTHMRHIAEAINNGTYEPDTKHPALLKTISRLKGALDLHTNGDREHFIKTYEQTLEEWEIATYAPPPPPTE